jgi:hypothetical protein
VQIRPPAFLVKAGGLFFHWGDRPVWRRGRFTVRRIDVVLIVAGVVCTTYYGLVAGWRGALTGLLVYLLVLMFALWF